MELKRKVDKITIFSFIIITLLILLTIYLIYTGGVAVKNPLQNAVISLGKEGVGVTCVCNVPYEHNIYKVYFNKYNYSVENPLISALNPTF